MGTYVLNNTALRSWWLLPRAIVTGIGKEHRSVLSVSKEEFEFLKKCDGQTELSESELTKMLLARGLIRAAAKGERNEPYLDHRSYENRYVLNMGINITERCNFNCLHCYEAVDNQIPRSEMSLSDCRKLLKEAADCGIQNIKITGGEPLIHKHFPDIVKSVYEYGMTVDRINTNGFFLTRALLDELHLSDQYILFNISYDGAGFHDWMRGTKGAEKDLLEKIKLLVDEGFSVRAAMTLNRVNAGAALETMCRMEELGVHELRIIRTSETPRWLLNAGDACLTMEEYYDSMLELFREYAVRQPKIKLNVWHFAKIFPDNKCYYLAPVMCAAKDFSPDLVMCGNARENITVTPDGEVFPCTPSPGLYRAHRMHFGNVFKNGLKKILQDGEYLSFVCKGVHAISDHDPKCASCRYFRQCLGGCRLFALSLNGDVLSHDPTKCLFFRNRYYDRIKDILSGYRCLNGVE